MCVPQCPLYESEVILLTPKLKKVLPLASAPIICAQALSSSGNFILGAKKKLHIFNIDVGDTNYTKLNREPITLSNYEQKSDNTKIFIRNKVISYTYLPARGKKGEGGKRIKRKKKLKGYSHYPKDFC